jgi:G:T-mismatch repair DNA endonuclease (very short patch repair protein)
LGRLKPRLEKGNNPDFWVSKISRNRKRDDDALRYLSIMKAMRMQNAIGDQEICALERENNILRILESNGLK